MAKTVRNNYVLNGGLLWCEKCATEMEGRSGTGRRGVRYYYYACKKKECGFRVPANEIEGVVLERIKELSTKEDVLATIVRSTNEKLQEELPHLRKQETILQRELEDVKNFAAGILDQWSELASGDGSIFIKEKLDQLGARRREIEKAYMLLRRCQRR
ncbi:zinc ribbon domain-containing protein [Acidobacteriota bacterium]